MSAFGRLWALARSRRLDRELDEEIAAHLAMQADEFRARGMGDREAREAARREFGSVAGAVETHREQRGVPWLEIAATDLRYAVRGLWQNQAFTAAAVLSLALGIGANAAIFSLVRTLLLRSLPVKNPAELVTLYRTGAWGRGIAPYPLYLETAKRTDLFQGVIARSSVIKVRLNGEGAETAQEEFVTGNYFQVLGIGSAAGRLIAESDNVTPHAHPVAVLSYDYWQRRFGGDAGAIGRTITANRQALTIIGVAAREFRGVEVDQRPDFWVPAMMYEADIMQPGMNWAWILARRRPGASRLQIQAAMNVVLQQFLTRVYGSNPVASFRETAMSQHIEVREGGVGLSGLRDRFGTSLRVLMAAVGLVLLASCANVANLLLARGAARRKEISMRVSLGATRGRLIAQALTESLLLAVCGAAAGVALAYWGARQILAYLPDSIEASPDGAVLAFTVLAAMLFGLGPAAHAADVAPAAGLRVGAGGSASNTGIRRGLVVAQVAFSVVLVVLAALFGHSMAQLRMAPIGFRADEVIGFLLDFPRSWTPAQRSIPRERLLASLAAIPGVSAVSYGFPGPFLHGTASGTVRVIGAEDDARRKGADEWINIQQVGPAFFGAIAATLREGRDIAPLDIASSQPVAVVNEAFLRHFLPQERHPLGRFVAIDKAPIAIVGVVDDIAHEGLRAKPVPTLYLPAAQSNLSWEPMIVARGAISPDALIASIRREAAKLGPQIVVTEPRPVRHQIDDSLFEDRLLANVGGFFGIVALALAAIGLYGVVAYGTARRSREIGIRIALGADRRGVMWMVMRDALALVALGLALGLPAAYAAARQVESLLFGLTPADGAAFAITIGALALAGLAAAFAPARRAAAVEPVSVLRMD